MTVRPIDPERTPNLGEMDPPLRPPARFLVGGVPIDAMTMDAAVRTLLDPGFEGDVHLCNAYTISIAKAGSSLGSVLTKSKLNLADGTPVAWVARRLGLTHMTSPVCGPDLMALTLERGTTVGARHYLYGSTPEVLAALGKQIALKWPTATIVGAESPPFVAVSDDLLEASVAAMTAANADIVWVGMGTPKQDDLVARMATLGPSTYVAIGAAFDFLAGTKRRAPTWMRKAGLEWVFRLLSEPRRLWKRYLVGNTRFLWSLARRRPQLITNSTETRQ